MAVILNTNLASLNTSRHLQSTQAQQANTFQRLSTGLRVNSAKDDAAGLYLAESQTRDLRGLNMAKRNAADGISLAQTAEGALEQVQANLQRINELAIQSANGSYNNAAREGLQKEVDQLTQEISRITETAEFNGEKLLNKEAKAIELQIDFKNEDAARVPIGVEKGLYGFAGAGEGLPAGEEIDPDAVSFGVEGKYFSVSQEDRDQGFTNDPAVIAEFYRAIGFQAQNPWEIEEEFANSVASALNGALGNPDEFQNALSAQPSPFSLNVEGINFELRHTAGTVNSLVGVMETGETGNLTYINMGIGLAAPPANSLAGQLRAVGNNPLIPTQINTAQLDATRPFAANASNPGITDTVGFIGDNIQPTPTLSYGTVAITSAFPDGIVPQEILDQAKSSLAAILEGGLQGEKTLDISSQAGAQKSIELTREAINSISELRASYGAAVNRFEAVISNNQIYSENLSASRSRIQDADFATETAQLAKQQVLQQAGMSSLTQANASPQAILALLG